MVKKRPSKSPTKFINNKFEEEKRVHNLPFTETRVLLSILGGIPCLLHRPYWPSLDLKKSSLLYCIVVYSLASLNVAWTIGLKLQQYLEVDPINVVMRNLILEQTICLLPHILGLTLWLDINDLSDTMKSFVNIQENFYEATGKELVNRRRRMEFIFNAFLVLTPIAFYIFSQNFTPVMSIEVTAGLALVYANLLMFLITFYWIGITFSMTDTFDDAQITFERILINGVLTQRNVFEFRRLWLSLRGGMDCMGKLQAPAAVYSISVCLIVVVLYEGIGFFQNREILAAAGHLFAAGFYFGIVALTCLASHRAEEKMKNLVNIVLPNIMLYSYEPGTQREMVMLYLTERCRPAVTTFKELTVVNKNLILAFISNISTYIIVLLQFLQKT